MGYLKIIYVTLSGVSHTHINTHMTCIEENKENKFSRNWGASSNSYIKQVPYWRLANNRGRAVFLNRRTAARSNILGRERFSWNLSFQISKQFSWINVLEWKYSEKNNIRECVEKLRPRCWPQKTKICYKISFFQWLITNLNVILYLSTYHTVYIRVL